MFFRKRLKAEKRKPLMNELSPSGWKGKRAKGNVGNSAEKSESNMKTETGDILLKLKQFGEAVKTHVRILEKNRQNLESGFENADEDDKGNSYLIENSKKYGDMGEMCGFSITALDEMIKKLQSSVKELRAEKKCLKEIQASNNQQLRAIDELKKKKKKKKQEKKPQKTYLKCVVCFENGVDSVIIPCGHKCVCCTCYDEIRSTTNTCPICRHKTTSLVKIFESGIVSSSPVSYPSREHLSNIFDKKETKNKTNSSFGDSLEPSGGEERLGLAMFDFEPEDGEELGLKEGESVTIVSDQGEWLLCRNREGREGYAPTSYIEIQ